MQIAAITMTQKLQEHFQLILFVLPKVFIYIHTVEPSARDLNCGISVYHSKNIDTFMSS